MSKEKFDYLLVQCAKVDDFFAPLSTERNMRTHCLYNSDGIEPEHKLAMALRWGIGAQGGRARTGSDSVRDGKARRALG